MATSKTKLSMKLLIDTKAKKVVFAEVEKDFVDFLFHILSLPVGRVSQLLQQKGMNGCLLNIYQSVQNLDDTYVNTKNKFLEHESPVGFSSVPLVLFSHFPKERKFYRCNSKCNSFVTEVYKSICPVCKNYMYIDVYNANPGVTCGFVKEMVKYMVMDDLVVKPMSAVSSITALKENFKIKDIASLQEEVVSFGSEEALKLLKLSFESKTILTSIYMNRVKMEKN